MKKRQNISICPLLLMNVFLVFASSCEKDDHNGPNGKTTAVFNPDVTYGTMADQDSNVYKTVTIGTQTWMAENLRTITYNDGKSIPNVTDDNEWVDLTTGAYCNYNNTTNENTIATYGRLYNWAAVNTGKLCPKGWHIPTYDEWTTLTDYLGGENIAGGKLKEIGTTHWSSPNTGATNETGFTALPGGFRFSDGTFNNVGYLGNWWGGSISLRYMFHNSVRINSDYSTGKSGFSVRCVKD